MYREELIEEGIVISASNPDKVGTNGFAEIVLTKNDNCENCSAKILCTPSDNNSKTLRVIDNFNTKPGDIVKISIQGSAILKASITIYGIPILLIIVGILLGNSFFIDYNQREFYSFLLGISFVSVYYILQFLKNKIFPNKVYPEIISINRMNENEKRL